MIAKQLFGPLYYARLASLLVGMAATACGGTATNYYQEGISIAEQGSPMEAILYFD